MATKFDNGQLIGAATGNNVARAKLAGATVMVQDALAAKAHNLGILMGGKFGTPIFDALQAGAAAGSTANTQQAVKEVQGIAAPYVKAAAPYALGALGVVALLIYLLVRRR